MNRPLHDDELSIDLDLVRALLDRDLPQYAALPLTPLGASGSTNLLFRLGDELLVRMPRQPGNGDSITKERRWSPLMASQLPVTVPQIVAVGDPGFGYPERWSVVGWIDGVHPASVDPAHPAGDPARPGGDPALGASPIALAEDLADVVAALRSLEVPQQARADDSLRWYRGRPLVEFDADTRRNIDLCRSIDGLDLDLDAALALWEEALTLPGAAELGPDRWYHGDLVAENLLLRDGRLTAVLDFGSLSIGDPTIDLHGAWEVLDDPAREVFRQRLGIDQPEWLRARAWALGIALGAFSYYWDTMPGRRADRLAMARNALS
ncbi:phosphotransferase [Microlunatus soli]|uniref:Predicted kinase, aminoglycoside phosphotransferase (APT) family n=1 Tax=Microlunatus soli TaxID=630515 RepID=A0A1H1RSI6_9ACTN|nr:phosphotransferase [Microlunatus soli]SDS38624.1 Predicted kinase, aminoglycoside phosphotransferase (APT) family [Microlunatus soli]